MKALIKGFKKGYGLIETLTAISILGIALTPIFHYELLRFQKEIDNNYKQSVELMIEQQKLIKEKEGFYYEFSFSTSNSNKYVVDGYEFMMQEPNATVNFDVYDDNNYECLALQVVSNKHKSLWDSCYKLKVEHIEL